MMCRSSGQHEAQGSICIQLPMVWLLSVAVRGLHAAILQTRGSDAAFRMALERLKTGIAIAA
jgi:hypothetical protein